MKRHIVRILFIFIFFVPCAAETSTVLTHSWASKKIDGVVWGISSADVDGDGSKEIVLLQRNAVRVGSIADGDFIIKFSYEWRGLLSGVRLYTMDLNQDSREEIIVSAVENGRPSSFALKFADGGLQIFFEKAPWHLRVLETSEGKVLIGQQWNSSSFFGGPVYEVVLSEGKIVHKDRIKLPGWADIYDFAILSTEENSISHSPLAISELVGLEGFEHVKVYERRKNKFKKVWSSGKRFGGTMNTVPAIEREPLGIANEEDIPIDREPQVLNCGQSSIVMAVQHDLPVKNIIGRSPYIKNGRLVAFGRDPALGFKTDFETEEISGFIVDFTIHEMTVGKTVPSSVKKLVLAVLPETSAFYENREALLLVFDLPL